jgi:hypothetical protein
MLSTVFLCRRDSAALPDSTATRLKSKLRKCRLWHTKLEWTRPTPMNENPELQRPAYRSQPLQVIGNVPKLIGVRPLKHSSIFFWRQSYHRSGVASATYVHHGSGPRQSRRTRRGWAARRADARTSRRSTRADRASVVSAGLSASRRQIRWTRLAFTTQPVWRNVGPLGSRHARENPSRRSRSFRTAELIVTRAGLGGSPCIDCGQAMALPAAVSSGTSTRRPLFTS